MAKSKDARRRARARLPLSALPEHMRGHIRCLRLATAEEYLDWCRANGFAARWSNKSTSELRDEVASAERIRIDGGVRDARRARRPDRSLVWMLDAVDAGQGIDVESANGLPRHVARALVDPRRGPAERAFAAALLRHVARVCPDFLFERTSNRGPLWIDGVVRLASFVGRARREIEAWRPRTKNAARRFGSLARHLFADWEVPAFLDRAWLEDDVLARAGRGWFVHIGQGANLRTAADLPIPMTKRMAHATLRAPAGFSLAEALRWGQIHGFGGDTRLACAVRGTKLTDGFSGEPFWSEVVQFLVEQPMFDLDQVGPIVDYLHHVKFEETRFVDGHGIERVEPPPEPEFSIRGRTLRSIMRRVEAWHAELGRGWGRARNFRWQPSGLPGYREEKRRADGTVHTVYTLRELCDSTLLRAEGAALDHCVAAYARPCALGKCTIWSLEQRRVLGDLRPARKWVTIEVASATKTVVQARARHNTKPNRTARRVIEQWARAAGLGVAEWV